MMRLKFVTRLAYGDSLATDDREPGDVPVYGSNGMVGTHSRANTTSATIVLGRKGSFGKVNYLSTPCFAIDTTFYIDKSQTEHNLKWLFYLLCSLRLDSISLDTGVPGLSRELAYEHRVPCCLDNEESVIANYLDRQTAKIDALIAKREELIALLEEKRAALISRGVTKGLDPKVQLKDSGTRLPGPMARHWNLLHLRRVVEKFVDYRGATPNKTTSGMPLVTARNIKNGKIDMGLSQEYIREEDYDDWMVRGLPEIGDVLVTTEAPLGESAQVVNPEIALAQRIILLKRDKHRMTNDFLKYYFRSHAGRGELWSRSTGSTALGIKASHLKEILVTVPPLDEQRNITSYLDRRMTQIDGLVARIAESIGQLLEYRISLVSAAVTGKIDVREPGAEAVLP
jgi:type I restriction enzyme S subunit